MLTETTRFQETAREHQVRGEGPHFTLEIDAMKERSTTANRGSRAIDGALLKDRMLEIRASAVVCNHPQLHRYHSGLQFCSKKGVLLLGGYIPSYYLKQLVQETLRSLEGVVRIENRIAVMR